MHFAKLTHILPLKKAQGCCYKGLFLLSPSPPSSVDCVELKFENITSTLHQGGRGEGRCLNLTSYCVSVPRVLTRVVVFATFCPDPDPGIFCIRNLGNLCFWNPESWLWNLEQSSRNPESRRGSRIQDFLGSTIKIQRTRERRAPFVRCGNLFYVVDSTMHTFF